MLLSDKFSISNKSNSLIELLLKIKKKKISYPYNKIKKYICKQKGMPLDKKTFDSINIIQIDDINYLFKYFKLNVIYHDTEFNYYDNKNKYTVLIFNDEGEFINFKMEDQEKWKSDNIPKEILILKSNADYILNALKIVIEKHKLHKDKLTIIEIIYLLEKHLNKKLSYTQSKLVYNYINPLLGIDFF